MTRAFSCGADRMAAPRMRQRRGSRGDCQDGRGRRSETIRTPNRAGQVSLPSSPSFSAGRRCDVLVEDGQSCELDGCGFLFFFFNDPATTEIYTLSLHDALPI